MPLKDIKKKLLQFWTASNPEWDTALGVTVPVAARVTGVIYDPDGTRRPFDHWYELIHYRQTVHGATVFEVLVMHPFFLCTSNHLSFLDL